MSGKKVVNVTRRTWDIEAYEKRARLQNEEAMGEGHKKKKQKKSDALLLGGDNNNDQKESEEAKEEFQPAAPGAAGPFMSQRAYLKARQSKVNVDSKIGSVEFVSPEAIATTKSATDTTASNKDTAVTKSGVGWHCKVCDCFLKDSHTYLDHINGRKHQRNLGYSMRVERSTKDQFESKLQQLQQQQLQKESVKPSNLDYEQMVKDKDLQLQQRKQERAQKRKERKERIKAEKEQKHNATITNASSSSHNDSYDNDHDTKDTKCNQGHEAEEEEAEEEEAEAVVDPALAAMMGFTGFGGVK